jgi:hypothetical protein
VRFLGCPGCKTIDNEVNKVHLSSWREEPIYIWCYPAVHPFFCFDLVVRRCGGRRALPRNESMSEQDSMNMCAVLYPFPISFILAYSITLVPCSLSPLFGNCIFGYDEQRRRHQKRDRTKTHSTDQSICPTSPSVI